MVYLANYLEARNTKLAKHHKPRQIVKGERRKHVISEIMEVLDDFRDNPWQHEGETRAGLRSALCLAGHQWGASDIESAGLVTAAFQKLGQGSRPSWDEGQRAYVDRGSSCACCGIELESGVGRYCSALCAKAALSHRSGGAEFSRSGAAQAAYKAILRETAPSKICVECGVSYKPVSVWKVSQKYCGTSCYHASLKQYEPQPCITCATMFTPRRADNIYCSARCHKEKLFADRSFAKVCGCCGVSFTAKADNAAFCTISCRNKAQYRRRIAAQRTGSVIAIRQPLTGAVFDGWFQQAA